MACQLPHVPLATRCGGAELLPSGLAVVFSLTSPLSGPMPLTHATTPDVSHAQSIAAIVPISRETWYV